MRKFSWYTIPKRMTKLITVYQYAVDRFLPVSVDKKGFGRYIHFKQGVFVDDEDGGWQRYRPNMKGGHHHRLNHCICNVCGKWFRRSKGIHWEGSEDLSECFDFCSGPCASQAEWEASLEADVGGGFIAHYWDDEGDRAYRERESRLRRRRFEPARGQPLCGTM